MSVADDALEPTWLPPADVSSLAIDRFRKFVNSEKNLRLDTYEQLHNFSVSSRNDFWLLLWRFLCVKCSKTPSKIIDERIPIDEFPEFFPDARLNYAENVLSRKGNGIAIKSFNERTILGSPVTLSWDELAARVRTMRNALASSQISKNDVVAFLGANTPNAVIASLATASLGAIFSSLAADMGERAILERLIQVRPKVIFVDNGYYYNGKRHTCISKASRVVKVLKKNAGLRASVMINNIPEVENVVDDNFDDWISLADYLRRGRDGKLAFEQVPFNHPMIIIFSSGTTGVPKGMVHSHGGPLLNLMKEHILHEDQSPKDTYYHYSNIGWTMWNIFLGAMPSGSTHILYDGSPFYPSPAEHLKAIISAGTTVFGGSPRYYAELKKHGVVANQLVDLSRLRLLQNTGAVLPAPVWTWMATTFDHRPIISFSGGTEVCGSFVHGNLVNPQYPGEITVKALGVDVDVFDERGNRCPPGTPGDLVIKRAIPNSAIKFWNDEDGSKYRSSYFEKFKGVWTQGDFCKINPVTGGIIMLGRSDGTLNPSGVRFGVSEIYSIMNTLSETIADSICVGQTTADQDEQVFLFVQMQPGVAFSASIEQKIRDSIAQGLSRRHVPKYIYEVPSVPYNVNGKKLEVLVKRVIAGGTIDSRIKATLVKEDDLDSFQKYARMGNAAGRKDSRL